MYIFFKLVVIKVVESLYFVIIFGLFLGILWGVVLFIDKIGEVSGVGVNDNFCFVFLGVLEEVL